ncbi:MAG TPA: prepilin-type N-terminal cleavage/methylation domain-containing protein [Candidatus Ozemobacteraceae bacterium]|nr:prepilin-type N-terminal cleavage/methylation domain-containing protein [Candidatus Ozemobacteraceae bacterium]
MSSAKGFTLLEVLITLLVMGLTTTSLLQLLVYGGRQYDGLARGWKQREALSSLRRSCRGVVMSGRTSALTPEFADAVLKRIGNRLRLSGLTVRASSPRAWFVQVKLFEDGNLNGREDSGEALPLTTWCFCERGEPS